MDTKPKKHAARHSRARGGPFWAKLMVGVGVVMMVVAGGTFAYATVLLNKVNNIPQDQILGDQDEDGKVEGPVNLLMIGADMRVGNDGEPARADTIMILHIDETLTKANIISIPRDLRVEIADCGGYLTSPCVDKINASYTYGGNEPTDAAANLAATVTSLTGIEFDGIALVNFEGFLEVVRTFGGIELCLPHDLAPEHSQKVFPKGCQQLSPDDALSIVRERYAWEDGDYGRQRMQQHFIKQLLKEAEKQGYVSDPTKVGTLIDQIGSQLLLDLRGIQPVDFAFEMRKVQASQMQTLKLPSEPAEIDGISYVVIQDGEQRMAADALFQAVREDTLNAWISQHPEYLNKDPGDEDE